MNDRFPTNHWCVRDAQDERGAANFITGAAVFAAAKLACSGRAYRLSLPGQMITGVVGSPLNPRAIV